MSEFGKESIQHRSEGGKKNCSMPLIMTIIVMFFIVSTIGIARWSLRISSDSDFLPTGVTQKINDTDLNIAEKSILVKLSGTIGNTRDQKSDENNYYATYFNHLKEYLSRIQINLSNNTAYQILELINDRNALIGLEKEIDMSKMSFDGREVSIYIYQKIYELCGLKLQTNMGGEIEQITDQSGNILFKRNDPRKDTEFQMGALAITIVLLLLLFCICYFLTKRNQLFKKVGEYDGFKEKRIA